MRMTFRTSFGYSTYQTCKSIKNRSIYNKLEAIIKIFTLAELQNLRLSSPSLEDFGPNSAHPYICFALSQLPSNLSHWLRARPCPIIGVGRTDQDQACDILLSPEDADKAGDLIENILSYPFASMALVQHLRNSESLPIAQALSAESFAYGTLQSGPEFNRWLATYQRPKKTTPNSGPPLLIDINQGHLSLTFNRPGTQNAIGVEMRDALCEALDLAITDPSITKTTLTGRGTCFSTGGMVEEFGEASDPTTAHWVRSLRLPAQRMVQLSDKLHMHVNGAAIGAGMEILGFAKHVSASKKAWFQLPELKYGLIPGAGGTAGLPRRIGRHKLTYMALSMKRINAKTALKWGLIDEIVES